MFKNKRILAFLLALVMVFGTVLPVTSFAADEQGDTQVDFALRRANDKDFIISLGKNILMNLSEVDVKYYNLSHEEQNLEQTLEITAGDQGSRSIKVANGEVFKDGIYTVTLNNFKYHIADKDKKDDKDIAAYFTFTVRDGKVSFPEAKDDARFGVRLVKDVNIVDVYVDEKAPIDLDLAYTVRVDSEKQEDRQGLVAKVCRLATSLNKVENIKTNLKTEDLGEEIATLPATDGTGFTSFDYNVEEDGTIKFDDKVVAKNEILAVALYRTVDKDKEEIVDIQYLNLWKTVDAKTDTEALKDIVDLIENNPKKIADAKERMTKFIERRTELKAEQDELNLDNPDDIAKNVQIEKELKDIEVELTKEATLINKLEGMIVAKKSARSIFDRKTAEEMYTFRIKIVANIFGKGQSPVSGAKVRASIPATYAEGEKLQVGKEVETRTTNDHGVVEFKLPVTEFNKELVFNENNVLVEGGYKGIYLFEQLDAAGMANIVPSSHVYVGGPRTGYNDFTDVDDNVQELTIFNEHGIASRIFGTDRYATALEIAKKVYPTTNTVVLASGLSTADALAAGPLANALKAPILLTQANAVTEDVKTYLKSAGVKNVVIVGGEAVVSDELEKSLKETYEVTRYKGADRYGTSAEIAKELITNHGFSASSVILANGLSQVDALSASRLAIAKKQAIVLTPAKDKSAVLTGFFSTKFGDNTIAKANIVGGEAVVSDAVLGFYNLEKADRFYGKDRFETALDIAKRGLAGEKIDAAIIANGMTIADALTASSLAYEQNGVIVLVNRDVNVAEDASIKYIKDTNPNNVIIVGGSAAVSENIFNYFKR